MWALLITPALPLPIPSASSAGRAGGLPSADAKAAPASGRLGPDPAPAVPSGLTELLPSLAEHSDSRWGCGARRGRQGPQANTANPQQAQKRRPEGPGRVGPICAFAGPGSSRVLRTRPSPRTARARPSRVPSASPQQAQQGALGLSHRGLLKVLAGSPLSVRPSLSQRPVGGYLGRPGPAAGPARSPRPFPAPAISPGPPCAAVHTQAVLREVSADLASTLCHCVSETMFRGPAGPPLFEGGPYLSLQASPSEDGGAVCFQFKDVQQLSVCGGQSHSVCGTGAGSHPHVVHNTQGCPRRLHNADGREGLWRAWERDGPAGGGRCGPREAGGAGKGPGWLWGSAVRL